MNLKELPDYLQSVVDDAQEYRDRSERPNSSIAVDVASDQHHLYRTSRGRDNLEVLQALRDIGCLCTDELERYEKQAPAYDSDEATIEAIVLRSLEELVHKTLSAK